MNLWYGVLVVVYCSFGISSPVITATGLMDVDEDLHKEEMYKI